MGSILGMLEDMEGKKPGEDTKHRVDELFRYLFIPFELNTNKSGFMKQMFLV